jgi:hypothetical protein
VSLVDTVPLVKTLAQTTVLVELVLHAKDNLENVPMAAKTDSGIKIAQ